MYLKASAKKQRAERESLRPPPLIPDTSGQKQCTCVTYPKCNCKTTTETQQLSFVMTQANKSSNNVEYLHTQPPPHQLEMNEHLQPWNYHQAAAYDFTQTPSVHHVAGQTVAHLAEGSSQGLEQQNYEFHTNHQDSYHECSPLTGDMFQPEEIFQLDQPLKPSNSYFNNNHIATTSNVLDLDSSMRIKYHTHDVTIEKTKSSLTPSSFNHPYPEMAYPFFDTPPSSTYSCDVNSTQHPLEKADSIPYSATSFAPKKPEDWAVRNCRKKVNQLSPAPRPNGGVAGTLGNSQSQVEVDYAAYERAMHYPDHHYQHMEFNSIPPQNSYLSTNYTNYPYGSDHYSSQPNGYHSY